MTRSLFEFPYFRPDERRTPRRQAAAVVCRTTISLALGWVGSIAGAESKTGTIRVDCEAGVTVVLDGRSPQRTYYRFGALRLEDVPAGRPHTITLTKPGFAPDECRVTLQPGQVEILSEFLWKPTQTRAAKPQQSAATLLDALKEARATEASLRVQTADADTFLSPVTTSTGERGYLPSPQSQIGSIWGTAILASERAEIEAATQFRTDYAQFQIVNGDAQLTPERKAAAWRQLAANWRVPAEEGPAALVWRNHRVEIGRGILRVVLGDEWPAGVEPPKCFINGRAIPVKREEHAGTQVWIFRSLPAATHHLRIEHPAIETSVVVVPVKDAKATQLTWSPKFKRGPKPP